jgi:hypothetical protein
MPRRLKTAVANRIFASWIAPWPILIIAIGMEVINVIRSPK